MRVQLGKKSGSLAAAAGLVVAAMALPANAANLLVNGAFESPTDTSGSNTDTTAAGWTFYGSSERAEFANHTVGGNWGIWQETFAPGGVNFGGVYQNVGNITDNTTYTLSAYNFFEASEPTVPGLVTDIALTFLNAGGSPVLPVDANGFSDANYQPAASAPTGAWTLYTVSGVAPSGATQVQVSFDFTNGSTVPGAQGAFVDDADLEGAGIPPLNAQWASKNSGDWNAAGNWTTGSIPNAVDAEADFFSIITSAETVYTNTAVTAGILHFNNANEYVISGAGSLTLQTSTGNAQVLVDAGTQKLDLPLTIASNTVFNVASGATLLVANPVTINTGKTLTQTGSGTVTYQSIITAQNNAVIAFGNSTYAHQLILGTGATASIGGTGSVVQLDSLSNGGTVDVQKNVMVINYGAGADPASSIYTELKSGYNSGAWTGTGINSSIAALPANNSNYGVGFVDGADNVPGATISSGQLEVAYALYGDVNLDGLVNATDFAIFGANFNSAVTGWDKGDFTYTGLINATDFALLGANFGKSSNGTAISLPSADYAALDAFAAANGLSLPSVPEPASMGLLALGIVGTLARRRQRSNA